MDTEARLSGFGLSLLGAVIAIGIAFAVSASNVVSLPSPTPAVVPSAAPSELSVVRDGVVAAKPVRGARASTLDPATKVKFRCAGCGVVEAIHIVKTSDAGGEPKWSYQMVVRFPDGSRRQFNETTPRMVQLGERVQVIPGMESKELLAADSAAANM